ncbi:hypothetical protein HYV10_04095 [Candidatus Dependentiae bacterium]|nr:hypothetical protein [Candidatus Dependentiae bacterium]
MKNKLLLILTITTTTASPRGGAFASGALLGTAITLAATSGSRQERSPEYYEYKREARTEANIKRQIGQSKKELKRTERKLDKAEKSGKNIVEINKLKEEIKLHTENIKELEKDLRS